MTIFYDTKTRWWYFSTLLSKFTWAIHMNSWPALSPTRSKLVNAICGGVTLWATRTSEDGRRHQVSFVRTTAPRCLGINKKIFLSLTWVITWKLHVLPFETASAAVAIIISRCHSQFPIQRDRKCAHESAAATAAPWPCVRARFSVPSTTTRRFEPSPRVQAVQPLPFVDQRQFLFIQ